MPDGLLLEPFDKARHDRERFDFGIEVLNDYFKTKIGQHTRKRVTRCYVLAAPDGRVAGYFTLSAGRLMVSTIPEGHGFPQKLPLPTTLLGRLAVDKSFRGQGLGEILLMHALKLAADTSEIVASAVIEVDAKGTAAQTFYSKYGFKSLPDDPLHMYLAMATVKNILETTGN